MNKEFSKKIINIAFIIWVIASIIVLYNEVTVIFHEAESGALLALRTITGIATAPALLYIYFKLNDYSNNKNQDKEYLKKVRQEMLDDRINTLKEEHNKELEKIKEAHLMQLESHNRYVNSLKVQFKEYERKYGPITI